MFLLCLSDLNSICINFCQSWGGVDTPVFWRIPLSGATSLEEMFTHCFGMIVAGTSGVGKDGSAVRKHAISEVTLLPICFSYYIPPSPQTLNFGPCSPTSYLPLASLNFHIGRWCTLSELRSQHNRRYRDRQKGRIGGLWSCRRRYHTFPIQCCKPFY